MILLPNLRRGGSEGLSERSSQSVSENKKRRLNFRDCSKQIDFTSFSLVFRPTLVVKIKKTQESTPSILTEVYSVRLRVVGLHPTTLEFWVRFPNERNQGKQGTLKYRDRLREDHSRRVGGPRSEASSSCPRWTVS